MIGLDTNVLVRYLLQEDDDQTARANALLDGMTAGNAGFIPTVVFAELYWVLTRSYRWPKTEAAAVLAELAHAEAVVAEAPIAIEAAGIAVQRGFDFADSLIAFVTRRAGCSKTVTFDRKASTQPGWELL